MTIHERSVIRLWTRTTEDDRSSLGSRPNRNKHPCVISNSAVLFPTHLIIAIGLGRGRFPTVWILLGAALPDLVDKPLAMVGLIATYHSIVHSALFGFGFFLLLVLTRRREMASPTHVTAVILGWASHLTADAVHITLNGRPANTVFLLWPVIDSWDSLDAGPTPFFIQYIGTTSFYLEVIIWLAVATVISQSVLESQGSDHD
jgi:hypothetical protein